MGHHSSRPLLPDPRRQVGLAAAAQAALVVPLMLYVSQLVLSMKLSTPDAQLALLQLVALFQVVTSLVLVVSTAWHARSHEEAWRAVAGAVVDEAAARASLQARRALGLHGDLVRDTCLGATAVVLALAMTQVMGGAPLGEVALTLLLGSAYVLCVAVTTEVVIESMAFPDRLEAPVEAGTAADGAQSRLVNPGATAAAAVACAMAATIALGSGPDLPHGSTLRALVGFLSVGLVAAHAGLRSDSLRRSVRALEGALRRCASGELVRPKPTCLDPALRRLARAGAGGVHELQAARRDAAAARALRDRHVRERTERFKETSSLLSRFGSSLDLDRVLGDAAPLIRSALRAEMVAVRLHENSQTSWAGSPAEDLPEEAVAAVRRGLESPDTIAGARPVGNGIAVLATPVLAWGNPVGSVVAVCRTGIGGEREDREVLELATRELGVAVHNALLHMRVKRSLQAFERARRHQIG